MVSPESMADIGHLNGMRLPAHGEYYLRIESESALVDALAWAADRDVSITVLGEGSNTVMQPLVQGLVMEMAISGLKVVDDDGTRLLVRAAAGENWHSFVLWAAEQGFHGLENLALIPGTVGAAPVQNIGAYGVELASRVQSVYCYDRALGEFKTLSAADCHFGYRDSIFKRAAGAHYIIVAVDFELDRNAAPVVTYPELKQALGTGPHCATDILEQVVSLRRAKLPDPTNLPNVGSFFKNPTVPLHVAQSMRVNWPAMPQYSSSPDAVKLSAAWMIDYLGWRDATHEGGIGIYRDHALIMVNYGAGSAAGVLSLATKIMQSVENEFQIALEMEPSLIGLPAA